MAGGGGVQIEPIFLHFLTDLSKSNVYGLYVFKPKISIIFIFMLTFDIPKFYTCTCRQNLMPIVALSNKLEISLGDGDLGAYVGTV